MTAPPFPVEDADDWAVRDGDEFPAVGRCKEIELGGETVVAEFLAGWMENGAPSKITVAVDGGWRHYIDVETWRNA